MSAYSGGGGRSSSSVKSTSCSLSRRTQGITTVYEKEKTSYLSITVHASMGTQFNVCHNNKVRLSDQKETGDTYGYGGSSTALKKSR